MNNYKIYNENEIKNKLQNFQEGKDYFVTLSKEPAVKDYTFFNDRLKGLFGGVNWVPARVWREKYDDQNCSYRGHFEEGKSDQGGDYYYSFQSWTGMPPADKTGWRPVSSEVYRRDNGDWTKVSVNVRNLGNNPEPKKLEPNHDLKWKYNQLVGRLNSLLKRPESDFGVNGKAKKEFEISQVKLDIADIERKIKEERENYSEISRPDWISCPVCDKKFNKNTEVWGVQVEVGFQPTCCYRCAETFKDKRKPHGRIIKSGSDEYFRRDLQQRGRMGRNEEGSWATDNNSDLQKENQELRQQLAQVQAELARTLAELKKLTGKSNERLEEQQVNNEKAITNGSVAEMKEQMARSQTLVNELSTQTNTTSQTKNDNKNSSLPYLIGGSVLVGSALLIGGYLVSKKKAK